jgi:hypothetical protein
VLGLVESDGVADGCGMSVISVGVGTGGNVSGGNGETTADDVGAAGVAKGADGIAALDVAGADGVTAPDGDSDGPADGVAYRTGLTGVAVAARAGAAPMLPAPPGWPVATGRFAGVASVQPIVTASGSPKATSPKKMDLGDNCTLRTPVRRPERLRLRGRYAAAPGPAEVGRNEGRNGVDQCRTRRVLSDGSPCVVGSICITHGGKN